MEVVGGAESLRKGHKTGPEMILADNYEDLAGAQA
jgi:hypothetical protein